MYKGHDSIVSVYLYLTRVILNVEWRRQFDFPRRNTITKPKMLQVTRYDFIQTITVQT